MKFVKKVSEYGFFTTWTNERNMVRVISDKADNSFYKYEVQKYNGKNWTKVRSFHTLEEAKSFCEEIC